jgi:isocitrate dehydrogenase (NAD+)
MFQKSLARFSAAGRRAIHNSSTTPVSIGNLQRPGDSKTKTITVLPGVGIGPELVDASMKVIRALGAPIEFDIVNNISDKITPEAIASINKTGIILKGEFETKIGKGTPVSVNIALRKQFQMYANVVQSFNMPGIKYRHDNVDIVIIRENTEGEYAGMEHEVAPGITESLKVMTREGTRRIAQYAFEYAYLNNRAKVTAVHKANIMKKADGIFLESCQEVAKQFPMVEYEEVIVDNCMMQLVSKPQQFDVMVTPNFYGSLVTNTVAGLVGGAGISPGANIGLDKAMFEQGARHVAKDIAGKDMVNPTAILFSTVMMLSHMKFPVFASRLEAAIFETLKEGIQTKDLGGSASTSTYVAHICNKLTAEAKERLVNKKGKGVSKSV